MIHDHAVATTSTAATATGHPLKARLSPTLRRAPSASSDRLGLSPPARRNQPVRRTLRSVVIAWRDALHVALSSNATERLFVL